MASSQKSSSLLQRQTIQMVLQGAVRKLRYQTEQLYSFSCFHECCSIASPLRLCWRARRDGGRHLIYKNVQTRFAFIRFITSRAFESDREREDCKPMPIKTCDDRCIEPHTCDLKEFGIS